MEVFRGLLFGDVEDVVDGHDAQQHVVGVDDGDGEEVVVLEDADRFLAVLEGGEAGVVAVEEVADARHRRGQDQAAQAQVVDEVPLVVVM